MFLSRKKSNSHTAVYKKNQHEAFTTFTALNEGGWEQLINNSILCGWYRTCPMIKSVKPFATSVHTI